MPDTTGLGALSKATGISRSRGLRGRSGTIQTIGDLVEAAIDATMAATVLPVNDSKGSKIGELLAAAVPFLGGGKLASTLRTARTAKAPIKAYHGSPHDFDEFSLSKIGTGEGAQAYGHGLYFADSEGVAKSYRDALQGRRAPDGIGAQYGLDEKEAQHQITQWQNYKKVNPKEIHMFKADPPKTPADRLRNDVIDGKFDGRMYEVNIDADPDDFLDWDAPLSQQGDGARKALRQQGITGKKWQAAVVGEDTSGKMHNDRYVFDRPREARQLINEMRREGVEARPIQNTWQGELTGREAYEAVAPTGQSDHAAAMLKASGIPGIKYLDGASRSAGQGSRNYVVFDDKLISIVKKYGIAGALGAGLINQMQAQQFQQQGYQ